VGVYIPPLSLTALPARFARRYYAFHPGATFQTMSTKHKLYVVFEVLQCVIFVAMALALGGLTATLDLEEVFARDVPENIQFDWLGNVSARDSPAPSLGS
jgi:hypothetical protein